MTDFSWNTISVIQQPYIQGNENTDFISAILKISSHAQPGLLSIFTEAAASVASNGSYVYAPVITQHLYCFSI